MTQQFRIDSESLRDKLNNLLPSQARGAIDVDLSGQTTIVPIVDLTETAEGSVLRQDLQTALSLDNITAFNVQNTTSTLVNTTGFYRVFGSTGGGTSAGAGATSRFSLTDGTTTKIITDFKFINTSNQKSFGYVFDFLVEIKAGESLTATSSSSVVTISGCTRQIADISGNLV